MKIVLLPTDFSQNARHTMEYAANLFADEAVDFILINTFDPLPMHSQITSRKLSETLKGDSLNDLKNEKSFLASKIKNSDTSINRLSRRGLLSNVLINTGKRRKADLVIMSPRGDGRSIGFGSNTLAVMQSSDIPVLVTVEDKGFQPFKRILFAADLQGYSKESLAFPLDYFVQKFDSTMEVVHFGTDEDEEKNQIMANLVHTFGAENTHVQFIDEDSVIDGLNHSVKTLQPDLLVLVNRHRRFFSKLFLNTVVNNTIVETPTPILVLHDKF